MVLTIFSVFGKIGVPSGMPFRARARCGDGRGFYVSYHFARANQGNEPHALVQERAASAVFQYNPDKGRTACCMYYGVACCTSTFVSDGFV